MLKGKDKKENNLQTKKLKQTTPEKSNDFFVEKQFPFGVYFYSKHNVVKSNTNKKLKNKHKSMFNKQNKT
ncbi:hypothetical protein EHP00_821 [Ecytonucleospora hepatopenaei]|uniref:Uncharacterized protein n=1 Tax=Ecytonucleospora hepatopenaei TaxID=646526 RepID=A0A1W0E897_9MICR|nr:hypothetical protein EHP00_821 [Ecytonucleospora hepatopenaei]